MKNAKLIAALLLLAFHARGFCSGAGTTAAEFLRQDPTARGFSMGGVYLPLVNDGGAAYVDPAVLGGMTGHNVTLSAWKGLDGVSRYGFAGIVLNTGKVGAFGLNYLSYNSGSEDVYDLNGNLTNVTLEKDYAASAGWGRNLGEHLFFGGQVKSVNSKLAEAYTANAVAFDAGLMVKSLDDNFTIGAGVENFGGELKYKQEGDPLPRAVRGEAGYRFALGRDNVIIGAVVKKPYSENTLNGGAGVEYSPAALPVALRAGMRRVAGEISFAAGLGLNWKGLSLDYGFQPAGALGEAGQRLSLSMDFGPSSEAGRAEAFKNKGMKRKALAMGYEYTGPKIPVSVLQPQTGGGVTTEQATAIADAVRAALSRSQKLQLVAREQTEQILREQRFQYSVCGSSDCAVEAGKLLGVREIFSISVMRIQQRYALSIKIIDVETGAQESAYEDTAASVEKLYDLAVKYADKIALE